MGHNNCALLDLGFQERNTKVSFLKGDHEGRKPEHSLEPNRSQHCLILASYH